MTGNAFAVILYYVFLTRRKVCAIVVFSLIVLAVVFFVVRAHMSFSPEDAQNAGIRGQRVSVKADVPVFVFTLITVLSALLNATPKRPALPDLRLYQLNAGPETSTNLRC